MSAIKANLEHVNVRVSDAVGRAAMLERIFGWHVRWKGPDAYGGISVHVGTEDCYLALYTPEPDPDEAAPTDTSESETRLNHIGVEVDNLDAVADLVAAEGITTYNHFEYEPGRRFYFCDEDDIEYEVVSYTSAPALRESH